MVSLTDEQKVFLDAEGKVILCACPGSGKTFIVGKKLLKYLESWPYAYRGVAVLSFTNVASEEVLRQTAELSTSKTQNIGFPHYIGTLDSFINNFIFLRFGYLMMQRADRKRPRVILENFGQLLYPKRECHKSGCVNNPNWFHWSDNQLLKNGQPISCTISSNKPCVAFKKAMLNKGIATQREVSALSLLLLKKYPAIASEIAYRFPVIIVDEAQDTSREQMEILDCLTAKKLNTLIMVGDPDQAIYEWRDATPEYFKAKLTDTQWNTLYLTANFRSSQHICNATARFSSVLSGKQPAEAKGRYSSFDVKPVLLQVSSRKKRDDVIEKYKQLCDGMGIGFESDSVAILTRGRIHADTDVKDLWQTPETKLFASATYQWHCASRKEAFSQCEKALFSMMICDVNGLLPDDMRQAIEQLMEYSLWKQIVISLLSVLPSADSPLRDWYHSLVEKIEEFKVHNIVAVREQKNITDIIKLKTRTKIGSSYSTEFLNRPLYVYFEKRAKSGATVSSVHGVKGESFDATLLIVDSMRGKTLTPSNLNTGQLDCELMRIAYVAMTRPRKLLVVSIPKQKTNSTLIRFPPELWDYQEI
ncbi:MAG: ATP-dependent helicase [Syntrophomonadaceae bacterium]